MSLPVEDFLTFQYFLPLVCTAYVNTMIVENQVCVVQEHEFVIVNTETGIQTGRWVIGGTDINISRLN